jgi:NADPH-dependent 2,4-dienoyl-CoA reductase/sulfur reductase-like enzyme
MGQKKPVQAFLLVTQDTLEEKLLATLAAKNDLAMAALDPDASVKTVNLAGGIEELKRRLEVLLGAKPEAPPDESKKAEVEREAARFQRKEKMAEAGGRLLQAALAFIGEVLPPAQETERTLQIGDRIKQNLSQCLERDEKGRPRLIFTLPDESIIDHLAKSFARILGPSMEGI